MNYPNAKSSKPPIARRRPPAGLTNSRVKFIERGPPSAVTGVEQLSLQEAAPTTPARVYRPYR
jgi:hypothetical protein